VTLLEEPADFGEPLGDGRPLGGHIAGRESSPTTPPRTRIERGTGSTLLAAEDVAEIRIDVRLLEDRMTEGPFATRLRSPRLVRMGRPRRAAARRCSQQPVDRLPMLLWSDSDVSRGGQVVSGGQRPRVRTGRRTAEAAPGAADAREGPAEPREEQLEAQITPAPAPRVLLPIVWPPRMVRVQPIDGTEMSMWQPSGQAQLRTPTTAILKRVRSNAQRLSDVSTTCEGISIGSVSDILRPRTDTVLRLLLPFVTVTRCYAGASGLASQAWAISRSWSSPWRRPSR
jgi:hypothetical protein